MICRNCGILCKHTQILEPMGGKIDWDTARITFSLLYTNMYLLAKNIRSIFGNGASDVWTTIKTFLDV